MARRKIISIDEKLCNGCGNCIVGCAEGALALIDGKAKLVKENFCDGFGDCIGVCPTGALKIEERESQEFDFAETIKHVEKNNNIMPVVMKSEISQWPLQLHLVPPEAPFFKDRELVILSTCSPVTSPDVHWRYIRGRSVVIACPKLDQTQGYVEKLAGIFSRNNIPRAIVLRMEVPCCGGLTMLVNEALKISKPDGLAVDEVTMNLDGEIIENKRIYG
jgi:Fe-S-cluster-containing hydrogenase component 2